MIPGPKPAGYTTAPYILPFLPDRDGAEEETSVQVKRDHIGLLREQQNTFYPQSAERFAKFNFTLNDAGPAEAGTPGAGPAQMMEFFLATMGPGDAFWCPSSLQCLVLSENALATDTVLQVTDTSAVAISDCIYIFPGSASAPLARTITAIDPVHNTVTVDSALGVPASAGQTAIFPLLLVRLEKPQMKMTWLKPGLATVQLQFNEVPVEQLLPADETLGITMGKLQERAVLFQFTRDFGNGTVLNYYYTSFESDIQWNGQTWLHAPFDCGDITQTLNLQDDNVTITSYLFPGNPLIADLTKQAEAPLTVTIYFANFDGGLIRGAQTMFTGDASAPSRDGNKIKMKCKMGPALLGSQLPIFLRGVQCSHLRGSNASGLNLISAGCTGPDNIMLRANWKATGLVAGPLSAGFPYTLSLSNLVGTGANVASALAGNTVFANWFANGFVEWGAGANIQRRMIVGSTVPAGSALSLTLHRYFNGVPNIGDSVSLYPGCDGLYTTCKAFDSANNPTGKFNNYQNFGGQPFTPVSNPSMAGLKQLGVQGTKK
ncbi:MAG TPA: phage BR0599 family protein [Verrucomicrobiae bacterium]|nr:phage BR0599 family protein [Verrucomicrobiae bacterium]